MRKILCKAGLIFLLICLAPVIIAGTVCVKLYDILLDITED